MYFSYVTLTTVGYGDFTAATSTGRMIAVSEALTGQLYLVSAVALLVGNIGRTIVRGGPATGVEIEPLTETEADEEDARADQLIGDAALAAQDLRSAPVWSRRRVADASAVRTARRCQGTTPSSSTSSEKLRNVRTRTIRPRVSALSIVWSMATVSTMSATIRTSRPTRIVRPMLTRSRS